MEARELHPWPETRAEAYAIQEEMAARIEPGGGGGDPGLIAAVDTAHGFGGVTLYACAVAVTFPELEEVERVFYYAPLRFPYEPGLLYFREGPVITGALSLLTCAPGLIIVHGHGLAHPRQCGVASHVGLVFDRPTIGCARRLLVGKHRPVAEAKGSYQPVTIGSREVGVAYRSRAKVKPIFISSGHLCDISQARDVVVRNLRGFRLPESLRLAHLQVNKYKRCHEKSSRAESKVTKATN